MANSHQKRVLSRSAQTAAKAVNLHFATATASSPADDISPNQPLSNNSRMSFVGGIGVTIIALLIPKPRPVVDTLLILMFLCFGWTLWVAIQRRIKRKLSRIIALVMSELLLAVAVVGFGLWVQSEIHMSFADTQQLTTYNKFKIWYAASFYRNYLKDIGVDVPVAVPVIGVSDKAIVRSGLLSDTDNYRMTIAAADLSHPSDDVMEVYGFYIFSLYIHDSPSGDTSNTQRLVDAIWLVANYYRCSFNGKPTNYYSPSPSIEKWDHALWDLRSKYGTRKMDNMMFAAVQQWKPYGSKKGDIDFNNYFSIRILAGVQDYDGGPDPGKDVTLFLQKKGLFTP
jgi:hypothetical protein